MNTATSLAETMAQIGAVLEDHPTKGASLTLHFDTDEEMSEAASALGFAGTAERLYHSNGDYFYSARFHVAGASVVVMGPSHEATP